MLWKRTRWVYFACLGIENQTDSDADMPLRVISYDGAEYRAQLIRDISSQDGGDGDIISTKKRRDIKRYPVVTLVLYFGYEKPWSSSKSLLDRLTVSDALKPYVQDYRINVFEIAYLTPEQVKLFQSDFRIVADYFVQKRLNHEYKPSPQKMKHVHAVLQMMSIMTGDHRFEDAYNDAIRKEELNMCEVLDRVEKKGYDAGRIAGKIDVRCLFGKQIVVGRGQKFDGCTGTEIRAADSDDHENLAGFLNLFCGFFDACEFFLVVVVRKRVPA